MNKRIFFSLIIFFSPLIAKTQPYLDITSIRDANKHLKEFIYILEDTNNKLDFNQINSYNTQANFIPIKNFKKELNYKHSYWLSIKLKNNLDNKITLGLFFPQQNHNVTVFSVVDSVFQIQKTGRYCKSSENDEIIPFSNIIKLINGKTILLFIRINSTNDELPNFSIQLTDVNKSIKSNNRYVIFEGFVQGMMWIMIIYGLFLFLLNKEKLYLYYSLYITFVSLWFIGCLALAYRLFPNLPREIFPYTDIPLFISFFFYINFIRSFIDTARVLPKWDKVLRIIQIVIILEIIRIPIFISLTNLINTNYQIQTLISNLLLLFIGVLTIKLFLQKTLLSYILGIGITFLLIGIELSLIFFLIYNDDSVYIIQKIGIILELIVFTFGISYRYSLIEKEKQEYQKKLIFQLNENVLLMRIKG